MTILAGCQDTLDKVGSLPKGSHWFLAFHLIGKTPRSVVDFSVRRRSVLFKFRQFILMSRILLHGLIAVKYMDHSLHIISSFLHPPFASVTRHSFRGKA